MRVADIIARYPEAAEVMAEYGLHCFSCAFNTQESLLEGCLGHSMSEEDVVNLVDDINDLIANEPKRPQVLSVTLAAAEALDAIATKEGKARQILSVIADEQNGFCMEFLGTPSADSKLFFHPGKAEVKLAASEMTLKRIGGSTIDYREGRFKLDVWRKMRATVEDSVCAIDN